MTGTLHINWRTGDVCITREVRPGVHGSICIGNLLTFATSLAVGAALTYAFFLGDVRPEYWRPGCGRATPGVR